MKKTKLLEFEIFKKENLFRGFFQLNRYHIRHQLFNGGWTSIFQREIFERGHAVAVLLIDPERDTLVLVEQFRPGAMATESNPWILELVAGMIEENEKPQEVARREALEESGCEIKQLVKICEYLSSPGGSTEKIWLYLGAVDSSSLPGFAGLSHENEDIKVHQIEVKMVFDMLDKGQINNAMSLIAIQWLKLNWHKKEHFWD